MRISADRSRSSTSAVFAVEAQHLGAEIGEQHGSERPRSDPCKFYDSDSGQWSSTHRPHLIRYFERPPSIGALRRSPDRPPNPLLRSPFPAPPDRTPVDYILTSSLAPEVLSAAVDARPNPGAAPRRRTLPVPVAATAAGAAAAVIARALTSRASSRRRTLRGRHRAHSAIHGKGLLLTDGNAFRATCSPRPPVISHR